MPLTKQQTDILILGNMQEFWRFESDADYADTSDLYDEVSTLVEEGETIGTDGNGNPVDIESYPIRQRPSIRPSY
jgi:hypothetical protein